MKTLKQVQEENRKFIIMACNPEAKTYEEALYRESNSPDCELIIGNSERRVSGGYVYKYEIGIGWGDFGYKHVEQGQESFIYKIIGKPLTLNRFLLAIYRAKLQQELGNGLLDQVLTIKIKGVYIDWDLTTETLEEQSEETQRAINELRTIK